MKAIVAEPVALGILTTLKPKNATKNVCPVNFWQSLHHTLAEQRE